MRIILVLCRGIRSAVRGTGHAFWLIWRGLYRTLDFFNLLEDDRPRLSLTKFGLWGATLINLANAFAQAADQIRSMLMDTPTHTSIPTLVATSFVHALAAAKAEMKRRTVNQGSK